MTLLHNFLPYMNIKLLEDNGEQRTYLVSFTLLFPHTYVQEEPVGVIKQSPTAADIEYTVSLKQLDLPNGSTEEGQNRISRNFTFQQPSVNEVVVIVAVNYDESGQAKTARSKMNYRDAEYDK